MRAADLEIRPATLDDASTAADIDTDAHPEDPEDPQMTRHWWSIAADDDVTDRRIALLDGTPVGYATREHPAWSKMPERFASLGAELRTAARTAVRLDALYALVEEAARTDTTQKVTARHAPDGEGREGVSDVASTISSQSTAHAAAAQVPEEDREPLTPRVWEHRTHPRVAIAVDIDLESESHFFSGLSGDVSEGGVFVQTYRDIAVGSEVAVEFVLPGGHVSAHGKVRWHRDKSDSSPPGVGIAFDELSQEDRDLIHRFCQARAPLYYDVEHA